MKILIACEFSGIVRDAFIRKGHDAISCDLLPSESNFGPHHQGDIRGFILSENWDLMIAHPPCTYLSNSGVSWLYKKDKTKNMDRWHKMREGAGFFRFILETWHIPKIAVENPIPHKYAVEIIGRKYDQILQPWMFGHPESKATCLWLKGLPNLVETDNVKETWKSLPKKDAQRMHWTSPGPDRWKTRSITYQGIAEAMADQWG